MKRRVPDLVCLFLILLFTIFFSLLAVQQHRAYLTHGLDLGNVDQALWNTAQGRFLQFSIMAPVESRLALHVEPILLLFVPFYWLELGGPEVLLTIQAVIVAIGAWPIYKLSLACYQWPTSDQPSAYPQPVVHSPHDGLVPRLALVVFPLAYLLLPTLQSATLFDFHAVTLAPTFLLFAFWALEQKNDRRFIFFVLLAMACKEDMPLVVAMLGVYAGLARRRWRLAGVTIGLSMAWFVVALFIIQPRFAAGGNIQFDRYAWLGESPLEMITALMTQPGLVFDHLWYRAGMAGYLTTLFFPTAFLALFSPLTLLPMLPTLAVNLLSDNPFTWRLEDFHYGAPLAPFLIISTMYGIRRIGDLSLMAGMGHVIRPPKKDDVSGLMTLLILLLVVFSTVYHYHRGYTPLSRSLVWPVITAHHRQLEAILATIPSDSPLFTQSNLAPHLSQRRTLYTDFARFTDPDFPGQEAIQDVVLDITSFENYGNLHQFLQHTLFESGHYHLVTAQDGILHLTTNDGRPPASGSSSAAFNGEAVVNLAAPFYTFAQPDIPPDHDLKIEFGDVLRLQGYSLHFNRQEEVQVSIDLELLRPGGALQPILYLLDSKGQPIGATVDLQPTLAWFPVEKWPLGEVIRVRFNTLPWHTRETSRYGLALGIITGTEVWDVGQRLRPSNLQPTTIATRFPAEGTLVELAQIRRKGNMPQGGPRLRQYFMPPLPRPLQANFGHQIKLLGHTTPLLWPMPVSPDLSELENSDDQLTLTLYWQAVTSPEPLIRFVQLIGPDGQLYGQQDSVPDYGTYPTSFWQPGEVVTDPVWLRLESDRPGGSYALHIGLYRPTTGERLLLPSGADHVEIRVPD